MKRKLIIFLFLLGFVLSASERLLYAEDTVHYENDPDLLKEEERGKAFFVEAYSFMGKLFFYCKIPGSDLKFKKNDERLTSKIYVNIEAVDKLTGNVIKKSFPEEFFLKNKRYVNNINFFKQYILEDVKYSDYDISISFNDDDSNYLLASRKFGLSNKEWSSKILISPPILMSYIESNYITAQSYFTEFDNKIFIPYTFNRIAYDQDLFAFQYYLANHEASAKDLKIRYTLENEKKEIVSEEDTLITLSADKDMIYEIMYVNKIKELEQGKYTFNIYLDDILKAKKEFLVEGMLLPFVSSFDLALKSLKYIATNKEYNAISNEKDTKKQKDMFNEFWSKRDKTPQTQKNEFMEEYYRRVMLAQSRFSYSFTAGWKTDMGRILIKYGEPDEIEDHPFEMDSKAYQIWYYYTLRKKFIFIDERGFGDYDLYNEDDE